jgi:hypothetical protein
MTMVLRLNEDRLPASGEPVYLPALERALYLIEGDVTVEFANGCTNQPAGSAWLGAGEIALVPGSSGVRHRVRRYGLLDRSAARSTDCSCQHITHVLRHPYGLSVPGFQWTAACG